MSIKDSLDLASKSIDVKLVKDQLARFASRVPGFKMNTAAYAEHVISHHAKFKNIFAKNYLLDVRQHYTSLPFHCARKPGLVHLDPQLVQSLNGRILIMGGPGAGKTTVLKKLYFDYLPISERFPVLLYLKDATVDASTAIGENENVIIELVRREFSNVGRECSYKFAKETIRKNTILLLDAFDELPPSMMARVYRDILDICKNYPELFLVVTSRPDGLLNGLPCTSLRPDDIDISTLIKIIKKLLPEGNDVSEVDLFGEYLAKKASPAVLEFCKNPLTGIMCYMVYRRQGVIEESLSAFFGQVIHTLWAEHDSTKGLQRKRFVGCNITNMCLVLEYVASRTYYETRVLGTQNAKNNKTQKASDYLESNFREHISKAVKRNAIDVDSIDDIVSTLSSSLGIIHIESPFLQYSHRSFEEYFAGMYVSKLASNDEEFEPWAKVIRSRASDSILHRVINEQSGIAYAKHILKPELLDTSFLLRSNFQNRSESLIGAILNARYYPKGTMKANSVFVSLDEFFDAFLKDSFPRSWSYDVFLSTPTRSMSGFVRNWFSFDIGAAGASGIGAHICTLFSLAETMLSLGITSPEIQKLAAFTSHCDPNRKERLNEGAVELARLEQLLFGASTKEFELIEAELVAIESRIAESRVIGEMP